MVYRQRSDPTEDSQEWKLKFEGIDYMVGMRLKEYREEVEDKEDSFNPERLCHLKQCVLSLTSEAKEVLKIVFEAPEELFQAVAGKRTHRVLTMHSIRKHLKGLGWRITDIESSFKELKKLCKKDF